MKIDVIPFRARHVVLVNPYASKWLQEVSIDAQDNSRAWTGCLLGDPIVCAGMKLGSDHGGEVWAIFSPLIKKFPVFLYREFSRRIDMVVREEKLTRVWSMIDRSDPAALRLIEHLGFTDKGLTLFERDF